MFSCGRDCPDRKPGCHGQCEKYKKERAAYDKRKAELNRYKDAQSYTMDIVVGRSNARAKRNKNHGSRKWFHRGQ